MVPDPDGTVLVDYGKTSLQERCFPDAVDKFCIGLTISWPKWPLYSFVHKLADGMKRWWARKDLNLRPCMRDSGTRIDCHHKSIKGNATLSHKRHIKELWVQYT